MFNGLKVVRKEGPRRPADVAVNRTDDKKRRRNGLDFEMGLDGRCRTYLMKMRKKLLRT